MPKHKTSLEDNPGMIGSYEGTFLKLFSPVSTRGTSKVTWSAEMNFQDTQTYVVHDLDGLKRFCHRGLDLNVVEEKVMRQKIRDRKEAHIFSFH